MQQKKRIIWHKRSDSLSTNFKWLVLITFYMVSWPNVNAKSLFWLLKRHGLQKLPVNIFYPKVEFWFIQTWMIEFCKLWNKLSHCYYLKQYSAQLKLEWNWITIQTYFECPYQSNLQFSVSIPTYIRLDA